jgi:hypothetical protein
MVPRTILPTMMLQPRVKDFQVWKVLRGIIVGGRKPLEPLRFSLRYRRFVGAQGETYTLGPGGRHLPVAPTAVDLRPGPGDGAVGSLSWPGCSAKPLLRASARRKRATNSLPTVAPATLAFDRRLNPLSVRLIAECADRPPQDGRWGVPHARIERDRQASLRIYHSCAYDFSPLRCCIARKTNIELSTI